MSFPTRALALRRGARALTLAALALLLAGCSMLGVVYNRLDTLVGFYVEELVTLTPQQSAQLDRTLAGNLAWHRESELRRYAEFLRDVAGNFAEPVERAQLETAARRTEQFWRDLVAQSAPGYTALALSLDDAQVSELLANLERQDEEEFAEYAERTPDEQHKRREKQLRRLFERFTGRLAPEQRALIAAYVRASPEPVEAWRAARANWRGELAATLEERADTPEFRARMHRLIATPDELWTEDYRHRLAEGRERFLSLLLELDRTLSPAQRASTRRELLALAGEVEKLIHA